MRCICYVETQQVLPVCDRNNSVLARNRFIQVELNNVGTYIFISIDFFFKKRNMLKVKSYRYEVKISQRNGATRDAVIGPGTKHLGRN